MFFAHEFYHIMIVGELVAYNREALSVLVALNFSPNVWDIRSYNIMYSPSMLKANTI